MVARHGTIFQFDIAVPITDIRDTLEVTVAALGGVLGTAAVQLEAPHELDAESHAVRIDASQPAGRALARAFLEVATRSLGTPVIRLTTLPECFGPEERYPWA